MIPLIFQYTHWHYTRALVDYVRNWRNFLWFLWNFFSIRLLLGSLFSPFHRLDQGYVKGLNVQAWAETILVNTLMRVVGASMRTLLIAIGLILILFTLVFGSCLFIVWLAAPLFVCMLVAIGFGLLFVP